MSYPAKRTHYESVGTNQFYNNTGTVASHPKPPTDLSHLIASHPSNTIVVADLPRRCSEQDLSVLFSRYGPLKNIRMVCNREAAVVEFRDLTATTRLVHMAKMSPFCVGPNRVRLEFASQTAQALCAQRNGPQGPLDTEVYSFRILHLVVAAADYPITVSVIKSITQPYGNVLRVFISKKNVDRSLEVLVEFESAEQARVAKEQLDGADIYSGCCNISASFSKLQRVHVTKNDAESWDFTGPTANTEGPLPVGLSQRTLLGPIDPNSGQTDASMSNSVLSEQQVAPQAQLTYPTAMNTVSPMMSAYTIQQAPSYYPVQACAQQPVYSQIPDTSHINESHYSTYYNQLAATPSVPTTQSYTPRIVTQITILPTPAPIHQVNASGIGIGHATSNSSSIPMLTGQSDLSLFETVEGVVLMACNLPPTFNCDHLFNLICVYGNIARIKFLKTRPGCAMVQVGNTYAAEFIHKYYNGVCIFGYAIQFYPSKQKELTEHEKLGTLSDGSPVMKNYMMDPNNRFRNSLVAAKSRILEPSRTLHFFNTPLNITPEDVCRMFTDAGASCPPRVVLFHTKEAQKTSLGLAEWDTLSDALEALVLANQRAIYIAGVAHPFHLKLAYSPKPISADRAGPALIRHPAPPFQATRSGVVQMNNNIPPPFEEDDEAEVAKVSDAYKHGPSAAAAAVEAHHANSGIGTHESAYKSCNPEDRLSFTNCAEANRSSTQ